MRRRETAPSAPQGVPSFDPEEFVLEPHDGWDSWTVNAAAVLYRVRYFAERGPSPASSATADLWLQGRAT